MPQIAQINTTADFGGTQQRQLTHLTPRTPYKFLDIHHHHRLPLSSMDNESRSQVTSATLLVTAVPTDVHEKIAKIVSLLSRALVIALGLLKALVIVGDDLHTNRTQHLVLDVQEDVELGIEPIDNTRWIFELGRVTRAANYNTQRIIHLFFYPMFTHVYRPFCFGAFVFPVCLSQRDRSCHS